MYTSCLFVCIPRGMWALLVWPNRERRYGTDLALMGGTTNAYGVLVEKTSAQMSFGTLTLCEEVISRRISNKRDCRTWNSQDQDKESKSTYEPRLFKSLLVRWTLNTAKKKTHKFLHLHTIIKFTFPHI